jgi:hypothetical protein
MVSGLNENCPENGATEVKPKKKLVFAANKKQAFLAILVMSVFVANSIYMVVKFLMEQKAG